jgi:hypothetical protein
MNPDRATAKQMCEKFWTLPSDIQSWKSRMRLKPVITRLLGKVLNAATPVIVPAEASNAHLRNWLG